MVPEPSLEHLVAEARRARADASEARLDWYAAVTRAEFLDTLADVMAALSPPWAGADTVEEALERLQATHGPTWPDLVGFGWPPTNTTQEERQ